MRILRSFLFLQLFISGAIQLYISPLYSSCSNPKVCSCTLTRKVCALDEKVENVLDKVCSILEELGSACDAQPIAGPTTITVSGSYCLTDDFMVASGDGITIDASNVVLDLNAHTIMGGSGDNGVIVLAGNKKVKIFNCIICNMDQHGILLEGDKCEVAFCDFVENGTGLGIQGGRENFVHDCRALENSGAGFALSAGIKNSIEDCKAIDNGS